MKRFWFIRALALAGAGWLTGCDRNSTGSMVDLEVSTVPEFSAKNGLLLPGQTQRSLGMKLAEVTEQKVASTIEVELRVYRKDKSTTFASGPIAPEQVKLLKAGQTVEIQLPGGGKVAARVTSINDSLQRATGSVEVLVEIPSASESFPVGAFVQATATVESKEEVVTIPRAALLGCSEGQFVYTVSGDHLVRTAVKVGVNNPESVEITDGLYAGDQVVLQPVMSLWLIELAAVKGGQACCVMPAKGK